MLPRFYLTHFNWENTMIRRIQLAPIVLALGLVSGAAHAALQGRDLNGSAGSFEAYYDTDLNITWLANANANGQMTWANANTWAANLSFTDGVNVYNNWRLPTTLQPDASCGSQSGGGTSAGYGCTGSEMGHLFYSELGGTAAQSAKFTNFQTYYYWSGTQSALLTDSAWIYYFGFGTVSGTGWQGVYNKIETIFALAVSPGDVGAVPEAQTYALMLAGLGLIGWRARRRG